MQLGGGSPMSGLAHLSIPRLLSSRPAWAVAPLLAWAHILAGALWAGMLLYTVRAASRGALTRPRCAAWLFALVIGTGIVSAQVLVPLGDLLMTGCGRVRVIKAALVGAAVALALIGPRWLRRAPRPGADAGHPSGVRHARPPGYPPNDLLGATSALPMYPAPRWPASNWTL
jgi:hypothetical protein